MKTKYKVLEKNMKSPFRIMNYEIGKQYNCEDFDESEEKCSTGLYATGIEGLLYSFDINKRIFQVEVGGKEKVFDPFLQRYEKLEIIRECSFEEIKAKALALEPSLGYKLSECLFPINPLKIKAHKVTDKTVRLLDDFIAVGDSVWRSVWRSVGRSVGDSVRDTAWRSVWRSAGRSMWCSVERPVWGSVWRSMWCSVEDSMWCSVGAYISSLFPNIKKWEYIDHEPGVNPFQCGADLWNMGFVILSNKKKYRLHAGEKAEIVYEKEKR